MTMDERIIVGRSIMRCEYTETEIDFTMEEEEYLETLATECGDYSTFYLEEEGWNEMKNEHPKLYKQLQDYMEKEDLEDFNFQLY